MLMNKTRASVAILALGITGILQAAGAPPDPLWNKALAVAAANSQWVPGLVITRSEVLHKGKSEGVHEFWQRSQPGPNGEVITKTVKVLEDGKDVTKKESQEADKSNDASDKGGGNPFDPNVQDRVTLTSIARSRVIAGLGCAAYAFEVRNVNGSKVRGTAWLEKESGVPREIENMTIEPLPDKHLKSLTMTTHYEMTNGMWFAKSTEVTSAVSVLFIKADIKSTITFSEHWKKAASGANPATGGK
jgi:hypothetical protein